MSVRIEMKTDGPSIQFDGASREDVRRVAIIVDPKDKLAVLRVVREVGGEIESTDYPLDAGAIEVSADGLTKQRKPAKYEGRRRESQQPEASAVTGGGSE